MDLGLTGKVAIVTGASRGIGLATARALSAEGAHVVGAARKPSAELEATGALPVAVDLTDRGSADVVLEAALEAHGRLDLLVNNVGGDAGVGPVGFAELSDDDWLDVFSTNLFATVRVTREVLPHLLESRGVIANVSSIGARQPDFPPVAYNAAKAALTAVGRGLATEVSPLGVRVLTVSPGPTRTDMWAGPDGIGARFAAASGLTLDQVLDGAPEHVGMLTGTMIDPAEVADLLCYLLSPRAASITGSDHLIDGGAVRAV